MTERRRAHLFRWWKHIQMDAPVWGGWISLGVEWRDGLRLIAYSSPDATPVHPKARGIGRRG